MTEYKSVSQETKTMKQKIEDSQFGRSVIFSMVQLKNSQAQSKWKTDRCKADERGYGQQLQAKQTEVHTNGTAK